MTLLEYIQQKKGRATEIARARGVGVSYISQMAHGIRKINPGWAMFLETFTDGQVSRKSNCNIWQDIWPELANKD